MCFYIEPMIVPPTIGTICIEDMVIVADDGCEVVTTTPRRVW
jgi:Xaa-Pro aminopeptidase